MNVPFPELSGCFFEAFVCCVCQMHAACHAVDGAETFEAADVGEGVEQARVAAS